MSPERRPHANVVEMKETVVSGTRRSPFRAERRTFTLFKDDLVEDQKKVDEGFSRRWYKRRVRKTRKEMNRRADEIMRGPIEPGRAEQEPIAFVDYPSVTEQTLY